MLALQTRSEVVRIDELAIPSFTRAAEYRDKESWEFTWAHHGGLWEIDITRGFPLSVLHGRYEEWSNSGGGEGVYSEGWDVTIGRALGETGWDTQPPEPLSMIPTHILWSGAIINTLVYAAVWFGLIIAPGAARRTVRRRRGRCVQCGYDLRGEFEKGCPECGWGRATGLCRISGERK